MVCGGRLQPQRRWFAARCEADGEKFALAWPAGLDHFRQWFPRAMRCRPRLTPWRR